MFKKNNKVKGSILFTVVSVMAILIIFLMGTLVLATSASNRAHRTYSTSQTQYTARTAIDSILEAFSSSDDFAEAICDLSPSNSSLTVDVELDQSTLASMGDVHDVVIEYVGQQKYYNENTKVWEDKDQLKITAQVTLGGITKTATGYLIKDPPKNNSSNGGGAGFVTGGTANSKNHTSSFGGTYFNIDQTLASLNFNSLDLGAETKSYWSNQKFSLTNGQVMEADVVMNGNLYINTKCIFIFPTTGKGVSVWGDLSFQNPDKMDFISKNVIAGNSYKYNEIPYLYVDGTIRTQDEYGNWASNNLTWGNSNLPLNVFCGKTEITGGTGVKIYADMYMMDNSNSFIKAMNSGSLLGQWTSDVLNKTRDLNAVSYSSGSIFSKGSLTLEDFSVTKNVRVENDLTINANSTDVTIDGDVVVGGKLTITGSKNVSIGGTIYCNNVTAPGIVTNTSLKAGVVEETYYANLDIPLLGTTAVWKDVNDNQLVSDKAGNPVNNVEYEEGDKPEPSAACTFDALGNASEYEYEIDDPENEGSKKTVTVTAPEYIIYLDTTTGNYLNAVDAFEITGQSYNGKAILPVTSYTDSIYPAEMEKKAILGLTTLYDINGDPLPKEETQIVQTLSEIGSGSINPYTNTVYDIPSTYDVSTIYSQDLLPTEITDSCTLTGDFSGKEININPGVNSIWINIDNVNLQNNSKIFVNDKSGGRVNFFISNSLKMDNSSIITTTFKDIIENNKSFQINTYDNVGINDPSIVTLPAPNIYIYAGPDEDAGYSMSMQNSGYITGYIKAPYLNFMMPNVSSNSFTGKIYYNGKQVSDNNGRFIVGINADGTEDESKVDKEISGMNIAPILGSLNVGKYNIKPDGTEQAGNNWTMLYIDPSSSSNPPTPNPSKTHWLLLTYYEEY